MIWKLQDNMESGGNPGPTWKLSRPYSSYDPVVGKQWEFDPHIFVWIGRCSGRRKQQMDHRAQKTEKPENPGYNNYGIFC